MSYENPWIYENKAVDSEIIDQYIGFVYIITNTITNRKYIGKKLLKRSKTKRINGKKKRSAVESDWKQYYGSNKQLLTDCETYGYYNFKRQILRLCKTKGECSYYEAKYQFENDVLEDDNFYNVWIMVRVNKKHLNKGDINGQNTKKEN